jgi:hypothetical protein
LSDFRSRIQTARFQDDVEVWAGLVEELMKADIVEGMKAALSGMMRSSPASLIKARSVQLTVDHAAELAAVDLTAAVEACISAAISSPPDSDLRRKAVMFITDQSEALSRVDFQLAVRCADFAVKWAIYDTDLSREAGEVHDRLVAREESIQQGSAETARKENRDG